MAIADTQVLPDDTVVVIGGGQCGGIAATRLLAAGLNVVQLDFGARAPAGDVVKITERAVFRWIDRRHLHVNR